MRPALSALLALALTACSSDGGTGTPSPGGGGGGTPNPPNPVATTAVNLIGSNFNPENIVVAPNAVVTFTNQDGINHNVTFASPLVADIPSYTTGARTATMPAAAAVYTYQCTLHAGMDGTVRVQ